MTQGDLTTILVAEDDEASRDMMVSVLRAAGYRVFGAIDGETAIKVVEDRDIDLALVDIKMTPQGGFNFVRYLLAHGLELPVIFVTADDNTDILKEATSLGVRQVMRKPVEPAQLVQTVQRLLKMSQ